MPNYAQKKALDFNGMGKPPIRKADTYNVPNFVGEVNRKEVGGEQRRAAFRSILDKGTVAGR